MENIDFDHFLIEQAEWFEKALYEIKIGYKSNHWIWYIFPQLRGLGNSYNSIKFGITSLEEAKAYLAHPILGKRLYIITQALLDSNQFNIETVLGRTDAMKVRSSMTLFYLAEIQKDSIFKKVIDKYYDGIFDDMSMSILNHS